MKRKVVSFCRCYRKEIGQALIFGLFPFVCAWCYCLLQGHTFSDIFLPASYWNDELMYFKQVEAVVTHGLPEGWFGFNEAHGSVFPFAAWNPVILIPWIIWGKLFGWNLLSPIYANLVVSIVSMVLFALLVKPSVKQSAFLLGLLGVFVPYTRYILSGMPESLFMAMGIIFAALTISELKAEKCQKRCLLFVLAVYFTLSRPYLGLFFLIPFWFEIRRYRFKGAIISGIIAAATAGGYAIISELCSSPYIIPLIETQWLEIFQTDGVFAGLSYIFHRFLDNFLYLFQYFLKNALKYGLLSGALYAMSGIIALLLLLRFIWSWKQKKEQEKGTRICWIFQFLATAGMILALFFFYPMSDGAKHLMIFIIVGLIWIAMAEERFFILKIFTGLLCCYFFIIKAIAPYDWQVAYKNEEIVSETNELSVQLEEKMKLSDTKQRYDNTVIWLASDIIDGESVAASWGLLYMIPKGYGINFCMQTYVMENIENLQSKYIALLPEGEVETKIKEKGAVLLAETQHMRVYQLY